MKLLSKIEYDRIENLLKDYTNLCDAHIPIDYNYMRAMEEIIKFFDVDIYREFLQLFYFDRDQYKNRYPDNRTMLNYLCNRLYVQESTLYTVRREIVYKSTMIFFKYNILKEESSND